MYSMSIDIASSNACHSSFLSISKYGSTWSSSLELGVVLEARAAASVAEAFDAVLAAATPWV